MSVKKKKEEAGVQANQLENVISKIRDDNKLENKSKNASADKEGIVDIITFCNRPDLLNLPNNGLDLFLSQRVILKAFYLGSRGNENVTLTEEEMGWLYVKQQNSAIGKIRKMFDGKSSGESNFQFSELNLACGRRSGKTLLTSVICAYEAYKILAIGDPYKFYGIPYDHELAIMNVANSQKQAGRLFSEVKARIRNSPFFKGRVENHGASSTEMRLYTDIDLEKMKSKEYNVEIEGSVALVCGHSNETTLRGYAITCLIFDELQYFTEHPIVSGKAFYQALKASTVEFRKFGDGRVVEISSTGTPSGIFHEIHTQGQDLDDKYKTILGFHLATWDINEKITYAELEVDRQKDPDAFDVEFGARWSISGFVSRYFAEEKVKRAIKPFLIPVDRGIPMYEFFMHLDPAASHDNYSLAVVYRKMYTTPRGEKRYKVILAFHKKWKPVPGIGLNIIEIDNYALQVARSFKPRSITYDTWNSVHSIHYLKSKGFYATSLPFGRGAKAHYYQNLTDLMERDELEMYPDDDIIGEFISLKYKPTMRGVSFFPDPQSEFKTDDLLDCIAGAAWMAAGRRLKDAYPTGVVMRLDRL